MSVPARALPGDSRSWPHLTRAYPSLFQFCNSPAALDFTSWESMPSGREHTDLVPGEARQHRTTAEPAEIQRWHLAESLQVGLGHL